MQRIIEIFKKDTANHELEVIVDSGVNRILRFKNKNGSTNQYFDILQSECQICFVGDMGSFVFSNHNKDMLAWFHGNMSMNYIAKKCQAGVTRRYSEDLAKESIRMMVDDFCSDYLYDYIGDDGVIATSEEAMIEEWADDLYENVVVDIDFENEWTLHQTALDIGLNIKDGVFFDIDTSDGIDCMEYAPRFKWCVLAINKVSELYFQQ